jgi:hypothetical protein
MPINNFIIVKFKKLIWKKQQETEILKEAIALLKTKTAEDLMQLKDQYTIHMKFETGKSYKKMLLDLLLPQNLKEIFLTVLLVLHQDT